MWIREWKCTCPEDTAEVFLDYLNETGVKDTQSLDGCCGHKIFIRSLGDESEITLHTYWQTKEQMKSYAGENMYRAVLYPEDVKYRINPDHEVKVYEVIASQHP
ncbi:antibiotic biosynthesis monooxygenase [Maridesulfovibrio sp.]|uniref:antibiotic biosynthesis monooxygenase n=1 Tax=Maridesulfovibrio sp. TaxID=2795000 RepID=UPI003BACB400